MDLVRAYADAKKAMEGGIVAVRAAHDRLRDKRRDRVSMLTSYVICCLTVSGVAMFEGVLPPLQVTLAAAAAMTVPVCVIELFWRAETRLLRVHELALELFAEREDAMPRVTERLERALDDEGDGTDDVPMRNDDGEWVH